MKLTHVHKEKRFSILLGLLFIGLCATFLLTLCFGAMKISPGHTFGVLLQKIFHKTPSDSLLPSAAEMNIIWQIRLPRVILGLITGAGLALCGAVMQATVQNPMAEPYILGISSGASLGATFSIFIGFGLSTSLGAFLGSIAATVCVLLLANHGGRMTSVKLVLSGMVVNALFSAISNFIISLAGDSEGTMSIKFWTMGSLTKANWSNIWLPLVITGLCIVFFLTQYRVLNTMLTGDEAAITLGINLTFYRRLYMIVLALLTGVLVSSCGIIGFVGLIIPHLVRSMTGSDHRRLLPASIITGAIFLAWADAFARILIPNAELPIGILTALVGAPFFVVILVKRGYGSRQNS